MANDIGPKIGLSGEREFKSAIKDINTSLKTLDSEMKLVTSQYDANDKSMQKLTRQNQVYEKEILTLNDKLALQAKRLKESADAYGEADARTMKLQADYNKTQAEINNLNRKIEENNKTMKSHAAIVEKAGKAFKGFAVAAAAATAAAIAGVVKLGKTLGNMAVQAATAADELQTLSIKTGITTQELQKMQYASGLIDVSVETMAGSMSKLTKSMASAQKGSGTAAKAFASLGVAVTKSDGSFRDRNEVFAETIEALSKIDDEVERDAKAMEIFGKSAQELNPLIKGGAEALKSLGAEAQAAGLILTDQALGNLTALSDGMDRLKATTEGAKMLFASAFAGEFAKAVESITGYVQQLTAAFAEGGLEGAMEKLPSIIDEISAAISEKMPAIVEIGSEILASLASGIGAAVPLLLPAASEALLALADALIQPESIEMIIQTAGAVITQLAAGIVSNIPQIISAAWEVLKGFVSGIGQAILNLIPEEGRFLITNFISGIRSYFRNIKETAAGIIQQMTSGISENLKEAKEWGKDLISGFTEGIKSKWKQLKDVCSQTASKIKSFLGFSVPEEGPLSDADTYGPDFMTLYADGIRRNSYKVANAARDVAETMEQNSTPSIARMSANGSGALDGLKIYLSTGELVGGLAKNMNSTLGRAYIQDVRGSMA